MLAWRAAEARIGKGRVAASPTKPLVEVNSIWGILVSRDPPTPKPAHVSPGPGCTGSEWEENATRAQTNVEVSQSNALGLSPKCPYRDRSRDTPSSPPHGSDVPSGSSEPPSPPPRAGDFRGSRAASQPPGKPAPRPRARLPGSLTYPKSLTYGFYITWLCRRLLGCKRAYFPLSFHAALGTGCSSFSQALVLPRAARSDTSLPAPGRVRGGRGRLLPLLCPQIAAWPCQRQVGARGGAGPGLFALPLALPAGLLSALGLPPLGWAHRPGGAGDSPKTWLFHPKMLRATAGAGFGLGAAQSHRVRLS